MHTETAMLQTEGIDHRQAYEEMSGNYTELLEKLREEVSKGFIDSHARANKNSAKALEIASFCYALIELLKEKGIITINELDERKKIVNKRMVKKFAEQGIGVIALQDYKENKYTFNEEVVIDCAKRIHVCHAACCQLDLALSKQDIEEGIVKWELGKPYMIARDFDGYCCHYDRSVCQCRVWQHRPIPCRGYDCRKDERIWLNFEEGIINPDFEEILNQREETSR